MLGITRTGCTIAASDTPALQGRGTMNLLGSDSALLDSTFDATLRWQASLSEYAYEADLLDDRYEYEAPESGR
jgi:hypothetical protein